MDCSLAIKNLSKAISDLKEGTRSDKLAGLLRLSLLTNPATHAGNILGNLSRAGLMAADDVGASALDALISAVSGTERTVAFPSFNAYAKGARAGFEKVGDVMHGNVHAGGEKYGAEVSYDNAFLDGVRKWVFRGLEAADVVAWDAAHSYAIDNQARVAAMNAGGGSKMAQALRETPTDAMHLEASLFADQATFKNRNAFSDLLEGAKNRAGQQVRRGAEAKELLAKRRPQDAGKVPKLLEEARQGRNAGAGKLAIDLTVPFSKVPTNVAASTLSYTPFGLVWTVAQNVANPQRGEVVRALAKQGTGAALVVAGYMLAEDGLARGPVSDGPQGGAERAALAQSGEVENGVRVGNTWIDVTKAAPGGSLIALGALIYRVKTEGKQSPFLAGATQLGKGVVEGSFLGDVGEVANDLSTGFEGHPEQGMGRFIGGKVSGFVPNVVAATARGTDPYERETTGEGFTDSLGNQVRSKVPGLRETLPPRLNSLGEPQGAGQGVVGALASPARFRQQSDDAILNEMDALDVTVSRPGNTLRNEDGEPVPVSGGQRRTLQGVIGKEIRKTVGNVLKDPSYWKSSPDEKRVMLKDAVKEARATARESGLSAAIGIR